MLGRNWQYQKRWTPEIAAAFFERLGRCRTDEKRTDALVKQGRTLALAGDLGALDLIEALEALDDPWLEAKAMLIRSYMHMRRGEWSDSYLWRKRATDRELELRRKCDPNESAYKGLAGAALRIPEDRVVWAEAAQLLERAIEEFADEGLPYNVNTERMGLAVLLSAIGDTDRARPIASAALAQRMEYLGPHPTTPQAVHNGWSGHIFAPHIFPLIGPTAGSPIIYGLLGPESKLTPDWVMKTFRSAGTVVQRYQDSVALTYDEITATFEWLKDDVGVAEAHNVYAALPPEKRSPVPTPAATPAAGFRLMVFAPQPMSNDETDITMMFVEELEKFDECIFFAREGSFFGPAEPPTDGVSPEDLTEIIRTAVKPALQRVGFTRFSKDRYQLLDGPNGLYAEVLVKASTNMLVDLTLRVYYRDLMSAQEINFNSTKKGRFSPQRQADFGAAIVQKLERECPPTCERCASGPSSRGHLLWTLPSSGVESAHDLASEIAEHVEDQFARVISTITSDDK